MNTRRIGIALAALGCALLLAACAADHGPSKSTPDTMQPVRVTGTVTWRERIALAPEAEIIVRLQDVSRMDAPAVVLAEQRFAAAGRQPPYSFEFVVDATRMDSRMRYAVSARVERQGQLLFINDTSYPVVTQGNGYTAHLMLVPAGTR